MKTWKLAVLSVTAAATLAGCAQDVPDINRVQENALKKSDFEDGTFFMRQTVTDVPPTIRGLFVGIATDMEKIRFEIQESNLIAYRSYEQIPGYDHEAGEIVNGETQWADGVAEGRNKDNYKEAPIATFPITGHFDIERGYSSSTGEQTNVISENGSDRPWHERKYFRVAWNAGDTDLSFPGFTNFYVQGNEETQEAFYTERSEGDKGDLEYFDYTTKLALRGEGDIEIVTSFAKIENNERDYEPAFYDDTMMTKFGYFRTERYTYERGLGFTDDGVIYLANRHDIWQNDYKRNEDGSFLRDTKNRRIPTPMAQRIPKPIIYYLSPNYPASMLPGATLVANDWDRAFTRAAAAAKGMTPEAFTAEFGRMYILCQTPVAESDEAVCDPRSPALKAAQDNKPYFARHGDLRRSTIFWVEQPQASGPLGFGPSYADPETGELVSGTAYVYGAGVDAYAQSGVDIVRLVNGDYTDAQIRNGDDRLARIIAQRSGAIDPRGSALSAESLDKLSQIPLEGTGQGLLGDSQRQKLEMVRQDGLGELEARIGRTERIQQALKESGLDTLVYDDEYVRGISQGQLNLTDMTPEQLTELREEHNPFDLKSHLETEDARFKKFAEANVYLAEFADEAVIGTALEFKGENDYELIWNELRNRIFHGVMAHEVGHTIGLRHNFQGSWDSINYFDKYWDLRKENFRTPVTVADLYEVNSLTQNQIDNDITRYQYSTIMDYHSRFNGDTAGIGKYDEAAIIFAYSFGTYDDIKAENKDPILAKAGFVEVFTDVPDSVDYQGQSVDTRGFMHSYDNRYAASQHMLEDFHYSTVIGIMGGPQVLQNRKLVSYDELRKQQLDGVDERDIEVPYMFCSDEWRGAAISCDVWDLGADPLEKVQWAIKSYDEYYPLTHFRRNRLQFGVNGVLNRAFRAFGTMPSIYQRWFYNQYYSSDQTLSNYFTLAAYGGFNWLTAQLSTPSYGAYRLNADTDTYQLVSYDPDFADADVRVDYGEGKSYYSDYANDGYYFFYRIEEVGSYWERLVAQQMLSASPSFSVLGADTSADFRSYILPYFLVFDGELTSLFNDIYLNQQGGYGPTMGTKGVEHKITAPLYVDGSPINPLTGETIAAAGTQRRLSLQSSWSERVNTMINGLAYFSSAYSPAYIDQSRVWRLGAGNGLVTRDSLCRQEGLGDECAAGNYALVTFTDLNTGVTYAAVKDGSVADASQTLAVQMIEEGTYYQGLAEDTRNSADLRAQARAALSNHAEDVVILLDVHNILGRVF